MPEEQALYATKLDYAQYHAQALTFFHPDCTVGPGVSPDHARWASTFRLALAGFTADRELVVDTSSTPHPAPKVILYDCYYYNLPGSDRQGIFLMSIRANCNEENITLILHKYSPTDQEIDYPFAWCTREDLVV